MTYQLGIDLGTTFTAAAVHRDGRSSIVSLGNQSAAIPSVVLLRDDGTELTGEAASRRATSEPERVAREFKRRLGDQTPIIVGGTPYSAEQLSARLLASTVAAVAEREGSAPDRIAVTHPANWGEYKLDLLRQAIRLAGLPIDVDLLSEPEAAAVSYALQERVEPGEIVAVYDLGGGTFDAAVLRRTGDGFEIIGRPEGIERMGGIDFDAAVFAHVGRALDGKLYELDADDPAVVSGVARLREECIQAKIALSSDTDATIPVLLPDVQTQVRITRTEFEDLIRPSLGDSIHALDRALESAGVTADDVSRVLLVGGSSRIPLISQMVSSELGRPVAVDADPKHAIALGAAAFAGGALSVTDDVPAAAADDVLPGTAAAAIAVDAAPEGADAPSELAAPASTTEAVDGSEGDPPRPVEPAETRPMPTVAPATSPMPAPAAVGTGAGVGSAASTGTDHDGGSKTPLLVGAALGLVAILVVGLLVLGGGSGGDGGGVADASTDSTPVTEPVEEPATSLAVEETIPTTEPAPTTVPDSIVPESTVAATTIPSIDDTAIAQSVAGLVDPSLTVSSVDGVVTIAGQATAETAAAAQSAASGVDGVVQVVDEMMVLAADEICDDGILSQERWACITAATFDGENLVVDFVDSGGPWSVDGDFHFHFHSDQYAPFQAGVANGVSDGSGDWVVWGEPGRFVASPGSLRSPAPFGRVCVVIATAQHGVDHVDSGNCWPIDNGPLT